MQDFATYLTDLPARPGIISLPPPLPEPSPILSLPRQALARLLAARSGHGDFASYHERFGHEDAVIRCRCGARTTPTHFIFCRINLTRSLLEVHKDKLLLVTDLLSTTEGAFVFSRWLSESRYFERSRRS